MAAKGSHAQHRRMTIDIPAIRMKGPREIILFGCFCFAFRVWCAGMVSVLGRVCSVPLLSEYLCHVFKRKSRSYLWFSATLISSYMSDFESGACLHLV